MDGSDGMAEVKVRAREEVAVVVEGTPSSSSTNIFESSLARMRRVDEGAGLRSLEECADARAEGIGPSSDSEPSSRSPEPPVAAAAADVAALRFD